VKPVRRKRGGSGELRAAEDRRKLVRDIDNSLRQSGQAPNSGSDPCPSCGVTGQVEVTAFRWEGERHMTSVCHACGRTWTKALV
jgi:hypothetical protein